MRAAVAALRQRVALFSPVDTPDGMGGFTRGFLQAATVFGALELLRGVEEPVDERKGQSLRFRLIIRWRGDVAASWQAEIGQRRFNILAAADEDGRRRFLLCDVEEILP
jgi:head-tail adaptor